MRLVYLTVLGSIAGCLIGCSSLSDSIEQRVTVSEQCRAATAALPSGLKPPASIASITLGNVGACNATADKGRLLAICSLNQITAHYGLEYKTSTKDLQEKRDAFIKAKDKLALEMEGVIIEARKLDNVYSTHLHDLTRADYNERTKLMQEVLKIGEESKSALKKVRLANEVLREAMVSLNLALDSSAKAELAAWDANFRIQLMQLERLLSGDFRLLLHDSLRDQVLTHVARRSLELLHGSLKPADAVLNRLDGRAYGAVSVAYLAFAPDIQAAVNGAYEKLEDAYAKRQEAAKTEVGKIKLNTKIFLTEVRRAACDNLVKGTQFSMLSELVDTMLITKIGEASISNDADTSSAQSQAIPDAVPVATPFSVYTVNEWAARQHLLTQKISAKLAAGGIGKQSDFPGIETIEESAVERLADAATAKTVDDAARLQPDMLTAANVGGNPYLTGALNVTTAANAVSMASVALDVNISVSNSNTFTPNNQNIVAPVINIPSAAVTEPLPALCEAIQSASPRSMCIKDGAGYIVSFALRFGSDSCVARDLEPSLTTLGQGLAKYRDRHGVRFDATVDGFASLPKATLARCPEASVPPANCRFANMLLEAVSINGCSPSMRDRNGILSATRARNTAVALEKAGEGAVIVRALSARGVEIASLRGAGSNPTDDQTILIRLQPLPSLK